MKNVSNIFMVTALMATMLSTSHLYAFSADNFQSYNNGASGDEMARDDQRDERNNDRVESYESREQKVKAVCIDKYIKAKAEYLTALASYAESKSEKNSRDGKAWLEILGGVGATALSIFFGRRADSQLGQALAWTTGTMGAVVAIDGIARRASSADAETSIYSRYGGFTIDDKGKVKQPSVPPLCDSDTWDMKTYNNPDEGVKCTVAVFDENGRVFQDGLSADATQKGFVCYSNDALAQKKRISDERAYDQFIRGYKFDEKNRIDCAHCN